MKAQDIGTQFDAQSGLNKPLPRSTYMTLVQAALKAQAAHFAREAALAWLGTFPGDLAMGLCYARALLAEGRPQHALPILDGLCRADPQWEDALQVYLRARQAAQEKNASEQKNAGPARESTALFSLVMLKTAIFALNGQPVEQPTLPAWAMELRQARQALQSGDLLAAQAFIRQVLNVEQGIPLAALTHLQVLAASPEVPLNARRELAERYFSRWPDTLACMLYLADWSIESGEAACSVALLHQAAARDVAGQVATRLWGKNHLYLPLWTVDLRLPLKLQVPAEVMAALGWNRLSAGTVVVSSAPTSTSAGVPVSADLSAGEQPQDTPIPAPVVEKGVTPPAGGKVQSAPLPAQPVSEQLPKQRTTVIDEKELDAWLNAAQTQKSKATPPAVSHSEQGAEVDIPQVGPEPAPAAEDAVVAEIAAQTSPADLDQQQLEALRKVRQELERLAQSLHKPGLARLDGRSPVYVIFSVRTRLHAVFGAQAAAELEAQMLSLAKTVGTERGWAARLLLADDPASASALGLKPARPGDAWALKRSLTELDASLAKQGQMIGAVLIVGGPEIVPFHHLPNPMDDPDKDVPSDNPYASRDENYFVPEWPVGRLAGGTGSDAGLLLSLLQRITAQHTARARSGRRDPWYRRWLYWLSARNWLPVPKRLSKNGAGGNFGYTAEIWRNAAAAVFQPIGAASALHISPPCSSNGQGVSSNGGSGQQKKFAVPIPEGKLGYFNLHGVPDGPDWYGQRDPLLPTDGPDYPVALRPQDVRTNGRGPAAFPQVVFSEACYGLNILGKTIDQAIALKFLQQGCQGVVGSTSMAYGTVGEPLVAADLLGHTFWRFVRQGMPAGEALRQAKLYLASSTHKSQGYLDGEDQKTLISFVFYGDPLAQPFETVYTGKSVRRQSGPHTAPLAVCEHGACPLVEMCASPAADSQPEGQTQDELLASVRQVVERYLPGMRDAQMKIVQPRPRCVTHEGGCLDGTCQSSLLDRQSKLPKDASPSQQPTTPRVYRLVTLSKQIPGGRGLHASVARLTLDEHGSLVKLVVSR